MASVRPVERLAAMGEATYPIVAAACTTRSRVSADTYPRPVSAREAVAFETPARAATSLMAPLMPTPSVG